MKVALISTGPWAPWAPSYALGLLTGIIRKSTKALLDTYDLNIEIYHDVKDEEHKFWGDEYGGSWERTDFVQSFIQRNSVVIQHWLDSILEKQYSIICFSVHSGSRLFSEYFADQFKKRQSSVKIIFGGPDCFRAEFGIRYMENPCIDYICVGEGDIALPALLNELSNSSGGMVQTRGIIFRDPNSGNLVDNGEPDLVYDLDQLPLPDYSWANLNKYSVSHRVTTMASRGCINRCAFCSEGMNFKKYRKRSAENIFQELKVLRSMFHGFRDIFVNFNDSLINGDMRQFEELLNIMIKNRLGLKWGSMALIREEMNESILEKMSNSGCIEIMWGLETGSDTILKQMGKRFNLETAKAVIENCSKKKIKQYTNIIVGFPGEGEKEFIETCLFIIDYGKFFEVLGLPLMTIRRNSIVYLNPDKYAIVNRENALDWSTKDQMNTYEIRRARRELLQKIMGTKLFDQGKT
jgi:anaerobic magnesium-protoporphyrin IX monomethyl ester cyclase